MEVDALENMPPLCSGEATGYQCKHYLHMIHRGGMKFAGRHLVRRFCLTIYDPNDENGMGPTGNAMAVVCSQYEPSTRPYNKDTEVLTRDGVVIKAPLSYTPPQSGFRGVAEVVDKLRKEGAERMAHERLEHETSHEAPPEAPKEPEKT